MEQGVGCHKESLHERVSIRAEETARRPLVRSWDHGHRDREKERENVMTAQSAFRIVNVRAPSPGAKKLYRVYANKADRHKRL